MIRPYSVACIQSVIREVRDASTRDSVILENSNRILSLVDYASGRFGAAKLVVLPEFCLQGFDHLATVEQTLGTCISVPGPETDRLAEAAAKKGLYLAASAFEADPDWPGRWFNSAFLIGPDGNILLRYRKIHCGSVVGGANNTSPGDIFSEYVARYGIEGLFPVVDTPLGRIGMQICYDLMYPEVTRALAMRGAEIILHPTGEPYQPYRGVWREIKHARAFENRVYLISANHGAYYCQLANGKWTDAGDLAFQDRQETEVAPSMRSHGHSEIIDYDGRVLVEASGPGEAVITAQLDIETLRYKRGTPGNNFLAQHMPELYAPIYAEAHFRPVDQWANRPIERRDEGRELLQRSIAELQARGVLKRSAYEQDIPSGGSADRSGAW